MKTKLLFPFLAVLIFASCEKKDDETKPTTEAKAYINTNAGSSWTYHETNSSGVNPVHSDYTLVSSSSDTSINGRTYHVYNYSYGGSQYLNKSGNDYYQYDSIPGLDQVIERLYLKDNASTGTSWKQDLNVSIPSSPLPIPVTLTNKIAEKGLSKDINGTTYTNVIHVTSSISINSALIPATALQSSIDSYYAENYGLIENTTQISIDLFGITQKVDVKTQLQSATLK